MKNKQKNIKVWVISRADSSVDMLAFSKSDFEAKTQQLKRDGVKFTVKRVVV